MGAPVGSVGPKGIGGGSNTPEKNGGAPTGCSRGAKKFSGRRRDHHKRGGGYKTTTGGM